MKLALWIASCLFAAVLFGTWKMRRAHKRLANARASMSRVELLHCLEVSGASPDVAISVVDWANFYLSKGLMLHPADRLVEDLLIDADDVGDFISDFYSANEMMQPTRKSPEVLPEPLSVAVLAAYLTNRRLNDREHAA